MKDNFKPFIYSGVILAALIILGISLLFFLPESEIFQTSPNEVSETCNIIQHNGGHVNVVFLSDPLVARQYINALFLFSPLGERKEDFNFYNIEKKPSYEIYRGIALLAHSKETLKMASACPSDYVVAIIDSEPDGLRSSSYGNVMTINNKHAPSVFAHEAGHALFYLGEEYTPARLAPGTKNCASDCSEFDGLNDGCFKGCSKEDYFRHNENSIMRSLASNHFGTFTENLIAKKLDSGSSGGITGNAVESILPCSEREYYLIEGILTSSGDIRILEKSRRRGCGGNGVGESEYRLFDENGDLITSGTFNADFIFTDGKDSEETEEIDGETFVSDKPFVLRVPVERDTSDIEVSAGVEIKGEVVISVGNLKPAPIEGALVDVSPIERILRKIGLIGTEFNFNDLTTDSEDQDGSDESYFSLPWDSNIDGNGSGPPQNKSDNSSFSGGTGAVIFLYDEAVDNIFFFVAGIIILVIVIIWLIKHKKQGKD